VIHRVTLNIPKIKTIDLELDDELAPKTVSSFLKCLPLDVAINSGVRSFILMKLLL
jgi:hypothetical protein